MVRRIGLDRRGRARRTPDSRHAAALRRPARALLALGALLAPVALAALAGPAAAVTCTASVDRNRVAPGEQIVLTLAIEGATGTPALPALPALDGVTAYRAGTSQSVSIVQGRMTSTTTVEYILTVERDGSFTIPPLEIALEGRTYRTQPIPIEVAAAAGAPSRPPSGGGAGGGAAPPAASRPGGRSGSPRAASAPSGGAGRPGDDLFVTLTADKATAYVGEQVVVSFRFHRGAPLWQAPQYEAPRSEGFWREDLTPERGFSQVAGGRRYEVTEIRYALFPTRTGTLVVEPAEVVIPDDPFGHFFGDPRSVAGPRRLRTAPLSITVKDLPAPRPADFGGVVATRAAISLTPDRTEVPRGEPVTLRLELTTDGFLKGWAGMPPLAPPGGRLLDAGEKLTMDNGGDRLLSRYQLERVFVPQQEGRLQLPAQSFTYFDARQGAYRTVRSAAVALAVLPSDQPRGELEPPAGDDAARHSQGLAFQHNWSGRLRTREAPWVEGPLYWAGALLPGLALGAWRWQLARRRREARDPSGTRARRAQANARRLLREAARARAMDAAYPLLARAVAGYVADRTARAAAALSGADVREYARDLGCEEAGRRLADFLTDADASRFGNRAAPASAPGATPAAVSGEVGRWLAALEAAAVARARRDRRHARRPASPGAAACVALLALCGAAAAAAQDVPAPAPGPGATAEQQARAGDQAYTVGDFARAQSCYEAARALGAHDPALFYNLGNAYARQGQLGRAVANYLRAQRLAPRDRDLRANLTWVRGQIRDRNLQAAALPPVVAQWHAAVHWLSLDEWSLIALALAWALAALLAWRWWRGFAGDLLRRMLLGAGAALILAAACAAWQYGEQRTRDHAVVVVEEVEVRSGPNESFPVTLRVHDGLTVIARQTQGDWAMIGMGGEWVGWVPAASLERVRQR